MAHPHQHFTEAAGIRHRPRRSFENVVKTGGYVVADLRMFEAAKQSEAPLHPRNSAYGEWKKRHGDEAVFREIRSAQELENLYRELCRLIPEKEVLQKLMVGYGGEILNYREFMLADENAVQRMFKGLLNAAPDRKGYVRTEVPYALEFSPDYNKKFPGNSDFKYFIPGNRLLFSEKRGDSQFFLCSIVTVSDFLKNKQELFEQLKQQEGRVVIARPIMHLSVARQQYDRFNLNKVPNKGTCYEVVLEWRISHANQISAARSYYAPQMTADFDN